MFNCSETFQDTFFLQFEKQGASTNIDIFGNYDILGTDDEIVLDSAGNILLVGGQSVDIGLKVGYAPLNNTPSPSQIIMKVNGSAVIDNSISWNQGYWLNKTAYSSLSGYLEFELTAEWWDVICNISQIQINYTKTNINAISDFQILGSGQTVQWNVTIPSGLNYFDSRITNFNTINFTIPDTWLETSIQVFNGATNKTSDLVKRLLGNGYREIQVLDAHNGTYWYLNATSSNLLTNIIASLGSMPQFSYNHSDTVNFTAQFISYISDGNLNLSVYTPTTEFLNYTSITDMSLETPGVDFFIDNWQISSTLKVSEYGSYDVQMAWNNNSAAGFFEITIDIFADTELQWDIPKTTFDSNETFNIDVFFNDTGINAGINADSFTYSIEGNSPRTDNITINGNGNYTIRIASNDINFSGFGHKQIEIFANERYHNNQSEIIDITILGLTELVDLSMIGGATYNSSDNIVIKVFYNDTVRNLGIASATVEYSIEASTYHPFTDLGNGNYSITISAFDNEFGGYGSKNIDVRINKEFYYNQSQPMSIQILGETSITAQRLPNKAYYNSAETFNISVYYEDIAKSIGISGATIEIDVDTNPYSPIVYDNLDGWYNITIDCSDVIFSTYKNFGIRINVSKSYYYNQTDTLSTIIVGNVSLAVLSPAMDFVYVEGNNFVITVEYYDTVLSTGINGATIAYSLNDGSTYNSTGFSDNLDGTYDVPIYTGDTDFPRYGFVDIIINASKHLYENATTTYTFHRQINTEITPFNDFDLGSIRRGLNVSYTFNYSDVNGKPITQATWEVIDAQGFGAYLQDLGNGNYTIHLDSTNAVVMNDHVFVFNISSIGNETQILQLTIDVTIKQTDVVDIEYIHEIARYTGDNQSIRFYFNDTTNNLPVLGLTTSNIVVRNNATSVLWNSGGFWLVDSWNNGTYILEVDMGTRTSGWYTLEVNVSKFPDYDVSIFYVTFYFRGNYTEINLISLEGPVGIPLTPSGISNYTIFEGSDIYINFNLTDSDFSDNLVIGDANTYIASFLNLGNSDSGMLVTSINFQTQSHIGTIITSNPALIPGRYLITITTTKINYENASFAFNLTIIEKYQSRLIIISQPNDVNAGNSFILIVSSEYFNGTDWVPIIGSDVRVTPYFNGIAGATLNPILINGSESEFEITVNINAIRMNLTIILQTEYFHQATIIYIADIDINPAFSFSDLIPYIILIGALVAGAGISVGVYRGAILPKKREKQRILTEVKTIFDDAINLEHILVLYKATGTCIYFKSYGSEEIDPELIGGFLSAVSSFGKEMVAQEALNEISYGDKMLLLADGVYIRVALVLGKKGSLILRRNLKRFIEAFENTYKDILPKWRGQLNPFRNAGQIVDDLLNTSIILPHQISYDFSNVKDLKTSHSRDILKVAHNCCEELDRKFFFIATLLKEATESTNKDTAEIFMGIKELRDKKMLIPIEISAIEAQPISQQEINLISQKVSQLPGLTNEEKNKMVSDLSQVGPIEREAYLASFSSHQEIVSAPIKSKVGTTVIEDKKAAKKQLKILTKAAVHLKNKKDFSKSIETYRRAAVIASNWELSNEFMELEEHIRKLTIEDLQHRKKIEELEAKEALKKQDYAKSAMKYKAASKIASEIFKLGVTDMTKEVKRLTNKANELDKKK